MFALWGADRTGLRDRGLRDELAALGVRRLQLNVDDDDVAPALRLSTGEQIAAVVSTWSDGPRGTDDAAVAQALGRVAPRVAGWRVDERRRLDPPAVPDGERADALANVALIRRPADLAREEWLRRWMVEHTPVAIRTQATFGYIQNVVVEPVTPDAPRVDGLVEELFPAAGMTDPHAFYGSSDDDDLRRRLGTLLASVARIGADHDLDLVPSSRFLHEL